MLAVRLFPGEHAHMMRRVLVILENGSRWPSWLDQQPADSVDLLTQRAGETLAQLTRRVVEFVAATDRPWSTATLVCSGHDAPESNALRRRLLRALLGRAADVGSGHVVLAADGSPEQRRRLARLAADLDRDIRDLAGVALRFRALSRQPEWASARRVA